MHSGDSTTFTILGARGRIFAAGALVALATGCDDVDARLPRGDVEAGESTASTGTSSTSDGAGGEGPSGASDGSGIPGTGGEGPEPCSAGTWSCSAGCCAWSNEIVDADFEEGFRAALFVGPTDLEIVYTAGPGASIQESRYVRGSSHSWTPQSIQGMAATDGAVRVGGRLLTTRCLDVGDIQDADYVARLWQPQGTYDHPCDQVQVPSAWPAGTVDALEVCSPYYGNIACFGLVEDAGGTPSLVQRSIWDVPGDGIVQGDHYLTAMAAARAPQGTWSIAWLDEYATLGYAETGRPLEEIDYDLLLGNIEPSQLAIALDAEGQPHVLGVNFAGGLVHVYRSGETWLSEGFAEWPDQAALAPHGVAFAPDGDAWIALHDLQLDRLVVLRSSRGWATEVIDPGPGVGRGASIAFDAQGVPHLTYFDDVTGALKYATAARADP